MKDQSFFTTNLHMKFLYSDYWIGFLSAALGWMVSFISPVLPFIVFAGVLVLGDLLSGTWAAVKRGEKLHSRGFRRTVEKMVFYFIAILLSEGMKTVFMPHVPVTYIVALAIAITEFKSNIENIETITGINIYRFIRDRIEPYLKEPPKDVKEDKESEVD